MQSLSLPIMTLLHVIGYGAVFVVTGKPLDWVSFIFGVLLIWISVVDADRFEIPDIAVYLLGLTGLSLLLYQPLFVVIDSLAGGIFWPLLFWVVAYGYLRARGFQGLGFGDVKLICGIGFWCGFTATIDVVLAASCGGILILGLRAFRHRIDGESLGQSMVAFGPFLCLSAWTIWLTGVGA